MTRGALATTSLVAAVPAGFLAYLTVRAFLDHADKMATMLQVVTGTTLLFSVLMALSPFAILLFVRTPAVEGAESAASEPAAVPQMSRVPAAVAAGGGGEDETVDEFSAGADEFDSSDGLGAVDEESGSAEGFDEFSAESEEDSFALDDDAFEFEDEEK